MQYTALLGILASACAGHAIAATPAAISLTGKGAQIYTCAEVDTRFAWRLEAPDAMLTDAAGNRVGHHFAGPSWQAEDGSLVVGEALVASPSPRAGAIPWLVLHAKSHAGAGLFAAVAYIVRSDTEGGVAPVTGCDAAHAGTKTSVDYSATYTFFPG